MLFILNTLCVGQDYVMPLWQENIPNSKKTDETERRDTTDVVRISSVQMPDITVYLPAKKSATGQAVVICPGGGYRILAYDWEGTDIAKWLNSRGIAAMVLKYRLPGSKSNIIPHKSPLLDANRAIRLTRYHATGWNISPEKIGIMGFSAGGHLASTAGTHFDAADTADGDPVESLSSRPDFMILLYPVITFSKPVVHKGSRHALLGENPDSSLIRYYSNELQVKSNTPPTFIIHAGDDRSVPVENSLLFYRALVEKDISAEIHIYPYGGHGFSLAIGKGYLQSWTDRCIDWLDRLNRQD
ncbi:prolyl oligopeptidase family serine peptidase [candidate division KSB1 bacterium]|nr:prolyl oligopeptidase family serine peptidase [candidate division KSB1 bacterium]